MKVRKTIFQLISSIPFSILIINACSKELTKTISSTSLELKSEIATRSDTPVPCESLVTFIKEKKVTRAFVPVILGRSLDRREFKDIDNYTLTTISKRGRDLMHIANFEGGGWAIVSGRFQEETQILAYSTEGEFDPNNIESPEVRFWLERAASMVEHGMIEDEDSASNEINRSGPYDNEPYVWLRIPLGYQYPPATLVASVNPLTVTKWGQSWPWCISLTPQDPTNNLLCPFGCGAVAYSQMLYYLHFELGVPSGLYHQIDTSYTWHYPDCYFTSNLTKMNYQDPSNLWGQMQLVRSNGMTNGSQITGKFILYIADLINTHFKGTGSSSSFSTSVFNNFGINCSINYYDQSTVVNSLDDDMPVVVSANNTANNRSNDGEHGHAWLIDGYKKYQNSSDYQEYLRIIPTDSLSFYPNLDYNMILTDSQKQLLYPGIEEYEIIHNYTYWFTYYFNMNWGWNNDYIGYYSSNPLYWTPGNDKLYNDDIRIISGFNVN